MGPTRKRDLAAGAVAAGLLGYLAVLLLYRWFPPLTLWTGVSLAGVAVVEAGWGLTVRARIADGKIGIGGGRLHPLAVARTLAIAKASAWVGALMLGWWLAVLVYVWPRRTVLRVAEHDTPGAIVAALCALALVVAGLWLQHCCKSPGDSVDDPDEAAGTAE
jgi:hypothetical protein